MRYIQETTMSTVTLELPKYLVKKIGSRGLDLSHFIKREIEEYFKEVEMPPEESIKDDLIAAVEESSESYKKGQFRHCKNTEDVEAFFGEILK